jgi:hypothetical protein
VVLVDEVTLEILRHIASFGAEQCGIMALRPDRDER